MRLFIGIDNGPTGTIGGITEDESFTFFVKVPTYSERSYTKKVQNITHVDYDRLFEMLEKLSGSFDIVVATERPLVNPRRFNATMSGVRSHEILLAVLRSLGVELYATWDSKEWQKAQLGAFGKGESKLASERVGLELFPGHAGLIKKHHDADGLLIAKHLRDQVLKKESDNE